ncbi:alpha/beta fold hydrolase [Cryptosporangium aurantiacum]|uniref:alpha/beta fold hydrolase n=1 Tax=Cryptosporangium aurantiacum TaxID=134849 RepID=UPI00093219BC|nr:alpha/beta hydrolase [Cryptosporangium aurantiacum]
MTPARLAPDSVLRPTPDPLVPPWPGRTVEVDWPGGAIEIHVRETPATAPDAEPALYVHGLGGSGQNWTDLADLLSDRLDGQAIDLPGFGRSGPALPGGYTQQSYAELVIRWIEVSGRGPVHLFGNSLGGAVVIRAAALRPDLVRTLTLISPAMPVYRPRPTHRHMLPVLVVPRVERVVERILRAATPHQMAQGMIDVCFADPSAVAPQRWEEAIAEAEHRLAVPWGAAAYVASLRGLVASYLVPPGRSLWRLAGQIQAPTLVIWGHKDRMVDVKLASRTAKAIPNSRLLVLRGVGHTAQLESPRIVARAVLPLIEAGNRSVVA